MLVTIHKTSNGKSIVAVCDQELLGKKFEENDLQLDLTGNFYKGTNLNEIEAKKIIMRVYIINVVGKKSIEFCIREKIIKKGDENKISNIPYVQAIING